MSIGNQITEVLNSIESFTENSSTYLLPLKVLGWFVLLLALIITNLLALVKWPISVMSKKIAKKGSSLGLPIDVKNEKELNGIISANNIVLVDFWAQWCGPCLLMDKNIIDIAREEMDNVLVVKVDVSLNSTLSKHFGVKGLPTVIVFKDGEEAIRHSGSLTKNQLTNLLK